MQRGSATLRHSLAVTSLGAITADEYLEFGEAVVHTLSYQQARHYNLPIQGVYVANPGYVFGSAGIPHGALITAFDGKKMGSLADFEAALAALADGAKAPVRYVTLEEPPSSRWCVSIVVGSPPANASATTCREPGRASTSPPVRRRGQRHPPRRNSPRPATRASIAWHPRWWW